MCFRRLGTAVATSVFDSSTAATLAKLSASRAPVAAIAIAPFAPLQSQQRWLASYGRVTNEDRRWWLIHLECCPDITSGTFCAWLDSCGKHTTKKLVERNIWTIEQVASLSSDQVDQLRYKDGCLHMDVVWEHARSVLPALKARETGQGVESQLNERILELRKRRELQRRREEIIKERGDTVADREKALREMREKLAKKKEELRRKQAARQQQQQPQEEGAPLDRKVSEMASRLREEEAESHTTST